MPSDLPFGSYAFCFGFRASSFGFPAKGRLWVCFFKSPFLSRCRVAASKPQALGMVYPQLSTYPAFAGTTKPSFASIKLGLIGFVFRHPKPLKTTKFPINLCYD